jgi:hypothetical protein
LQAKKEAHQSNPGGHTKTKTPACAHAICVPLHTLWSRYGGGFLPQNMAGIPT